MDFIDATYHIKEKSNFLISKQEYERKLDVLTQASESKVPGEIDIFRNQIYGYESNFYTGFQGNNLYELYWIWVLSDVTTTISNVLKRKVFRGGIDLKAKGGEINLEEEKQVKKFLRCCNSNNQSYLDVLREIYDDMNWADTGVQLNLIDYFINNSKQIAGGRLREVMRINPLNVQEIKDTKTFELGKEAGKQVFTNIQDRSIKTFEPIDRKTGIPNIPAHYRIRTQTGYKYYNSKELIIKHKFKERTGFSPIHSTKHKIITLMEMDYYVKKEYSEGKPSKKMLAFKVQNRDAMKEAYKDYADKIRDNPNGLHPLIIQSPPDNRQPLAEVIDFMKPLNEMQYNEMRARYITDIGAVWGTSPMFHNDMSTGGGLNNEGLQMTVTNEVVEDDKARLEVDFITPTFEQLGIVTIDVCLFPNREEDLMYKEEIFSKQLLNVQQFTSLGGKVTYANGEFVFSDTNFERQELPDFDLNDDGDDNSEYEPLNLRKDVDEEEISTILSANDMIQALNDELSKQDIQDIEKHKYVKRIGSKGNYKYFYTQDEYKQYLREQKEKKKPSQSKVNNTYELNVSPENIDIKGEKLDEYLMNQSFQEFVTGEPFTQEEVTRVMESVDKYNHKINNVVFLDKSAEENVAFVISDDEKQRIFMSAKDGGELTRLGQYKLFMKKNSNLDYDNIKTLTKDDWTRKTLLHEDSHIQIINKLGQGKKAPDANDIMSVDSRYENYLDLLLEMNSDFIINPNLTNEVLAEDLRIIRARKNNDPTQHILSKDTHEYDIANPQEYEQRLKILENLFYGGN